MKIRLSVFKADVGSIGGHTRPSERMLSVVRGRLGQAARRPSFSRRKRSWSPYMLGHFVTGDCRGSHVMPLMPVRVNTAVAGPFCLPIVSCLAFAMDPDGNFAQEYVDAFGDGVWDATRLKVQQKADEWRRQGFIGPTLTSHGELAYAGIMGSVVGAQAVAGV
jgi:fructose 1,6-bisphosphatase